MDLTTIYKRPPLPFIGNKTKWIKDLIKYFVNNHNKFKDFVFVDVFGGSGIVSSLLAKLYPNNKIIYNDYDNYTSLLKPSSINKLNQLRREIYEITKNYKKDAPINSNDSLKIKRLIIKYYPNYNNNVRLKNVLAGWLMFNASNFNIENIFYNRVNSSDFDILYDYLPDNVIIEHLDYEDLLQKYH